MNLFGSEPARGRKRERPFSDYLIISEPNSCGQGFNPHHAENPYHAALIGQGWTYSHSTPIRNLNGTYFAIIVYEFPNSDWVIGIKARADWGIHFSRRGSGVYTSISPRGFNVYLKRKTSEIRASLNKERGTK